MKYFNMEELRKIDTQKVAMFFANTLRDSVDTREYHITAASIAYVAIVAKEMKLQGTVDEILSGKEEDERISHMVMRYAADYWEMMSEKVQEFTEEQLQAFILFDNSLEDIRSGVVATPHGVLHLVNNILNIQAKDNLLELCSGKAGFAIDCITDNAPASYTGVELNYMATDMAILRSYVARARANFTLADALEYRSVQKFDKVFAHYPFMLRTPSMDEHKQKISAALDMPETILQKASSDWVFNATMLDHLKAKGKAVAIMTNGSTWNTSDREIRKYFVEKGYIEAVIALPAKLFSDTAIATTMIVLSFNNKQIRMVDARNVYSVDHRGNILDEESVTKIMSLLEHNEANSMLKTPEELAENDYVLNAARYSEETPVFENGVPFGSIITNVMRGAQIKTTELEAMKSETPTKQQYLTLANIQDGIISIEETQDLKDIPVSLEKFFIPNHALLLSKIGVPGFKSAVAEIPDEHKLLATGNLFVIQLDEKRANPYYIQAFFASEVGKALFKSIHTGAIYPTLSASKLKEMIVPLPPMEEQNRIADRYAAALDQVVLLRRKLNKATSALMHIYDEEG